MAVNIEGLVGALGSPGKFQCCLAAAICISMVLVSMHHLSMVFMGATPPHHCKISNEFPVNTSIPMIHKEGTMVLDRCHMYVNPANHSMGTKECTNGWTYLYQRGEWSVAGEFDLVCKSSYLLSLVSTIYFSGTVVGSVVFGHIADRVGRKPVFLTTLCGQSLIGVVQYFTDSYQMFVLFKFLHGFLIQGMYASLLCLVMELFHTAWRTEASIFLNLMYTIGEFVLVGLAYFNPNWKYFYLVSTVPSLAGLVYIWLIPESLRWLLVNGYKKQALSVSRRFASFNKIKLDEYIEDEIYRVTEKRTECEQAKDKHNFRDLFRNRVVRRTSFVISYMWFAMAFVYFGVNFSLQSLHGDKYFNFVISVCVEFVCRVLTYPGLKLLGRRLTGSMCFLLTGVACVASAVIATNLETESAHAIATGLAIFARAAGSCTFVCVILQTQESFPTVLRSNALGLGGVFNRIGSMAAPQVVLLGTYTSPMVPFIVLGFVALIAAFVCLLMPETLKTPLPDTLEQAENLNKKQKSGKKKRDFNLSMASTSDSAIQLTDKDPSQMMSTVYLCSVKELHSPSEVNRSDEMDRETSCSTVSSIKPTAPSPPAILKLADSMSEDLMKDLKKCARFQKEGAVNHH